MRDTRVMLLTVARVFSRFIAEIKHRNSRQSAYLSRIRAWAGSLLCMREAGLGLLLQNMPMVSKIACFTESVPGDIHGK